VLREAPPVLIGEEARREICRAERRAARVELDVRAAAAASDEVGATVAVHVGDADRARVPWVSPADRVGEESRHALWWSERASAERKLHVDPVAAAADEVGATVAVHVGRLHAVAI